MATGGALPADWSIVWEGRHGPAYDEQAFHYLLGLERRRTAQRGLPLVLILVELQVQSPLRNAPARAARLFSVLSACARETDIVGWYRREHMAGLVLTELGRDVVTEVLALLKIRIEAALGRRRAKVGSYRLHMRIDAVADPSAGDEDSC
jgi:hypothetical protein